MISQGPVRFSFQLQHLDYSSSEGHNLGYLTTNFTTSWRTDSWEVKDYATRKLKKKVNLWDQSILGA